MIDFVRLTEVDLEDVLAVLNEPRNVRHMPLAGGDVLTSGSAAAWIVAKDDQWDEHGFGPWAILLDGRFAGRGGLQAEANGADFALVLLPGLWGTASASPAPRSTGASPSSASRRS